VDSFHVAVRFPPEIFCGFGIPFTFFPWWSGLLIGASLAITFVPSRSSVALGTHTDQRINRRLTAWAIYEVGARPQCCRWESCEL
jgi:hypothetical protein